MVHSLFTSESVSKGHPDKVADQISDAVLDACLADDPESRVACETIINRNLVVLGGEISSQAKPHYRDIVYQTIEKIGYTDAQLGFDLQNFELMEAVHKQSPDISMGVSEGEGMYEQMGAGDQGMMFGYACDETPELMPLPIMMAHGLIGELLRWRTQKVLPYLRPDAKCQVTVEYDQEQQPVRIHTVVISTQHDEGVRHATIVDDMRTLVSEVVPHEWLDEKTLYFINPTGRFVEGGPGADCGLTGRKIIVDTYGGMARHGGGCFSGKDPSKVDRSAAYAARYVAKNIVAAGLAKRCEVQLAYAIGVPYPVSIKVDTFGTSSFDTEKITQALPQVFDLSPKGIIEMLDLKRPIYYHTAYGGHFGRTDAQFTWERVDRVALLQEAVQKQVEIETPSC